MVILKPLNIYCYTVLLRYIVLLQNPCGATPNGHITLHDASTNPSIKGWIRQWLEKGRSDKTRIEILTTAWSIRRDRCCRVFQQKITQLSSTARLAIRLFNDTIDLLNSELDQRVNNTSSDLHNHSVSDSNTVSYGNLLEDCILVYCDASFDKNTNTTGIGIYMTTAAGTFKGCKTIKGLARNPEEAECLAVLETIKWAHSKNLSSISIYSDAKKVIDYLKNKNGSLC